jgi:hypothetical protein
MAYVCELGSGQRIYLDNQGGQTIVLIASSAPGQQQQASNSLNTGLWTSPPIAYQTPNGVVFKIVTAQGEHYIQCQGSSMGVVSSAAFAGSGSQQMQIQQVAGMPSSSMPSMQPMPPMQPMPSMQLMKPMEPMQPMPPMQPMSMGDMQMNMNPMQMRMGNMEMQMGKPVTPATAAPGTHRFCSQCGAAVELGDRFCASCGHRLKTAE